LFRRADELIDFGDFAATKNGKWHKLGHIGEDPDDWD